MSTNALLDQDFGSESEDDNFNPAPADESDNENVAGPDAKDEPTSRSNFRITNGHDAESDGLEEENADDDKNSGGRRTSARPFTGPGLAGEHDAEGLNGDGAEEEEADEDLDEEEDDDEEEEVISVLAPNLCLFVLC